VVFKEVLVRLMSTGKSVRSEVPLTLEESMVSGMEQVNSAMGGIVLGQFFSQL
jgi:hypothetical protein